MSPMSPPPTLQAEGHPYWDIRNPPGMVDRYSHVVNARMHAMRRNLDMWQREDFKIEKDKCDKHRLRSK